MNLLVLILLGGVFIVASLSLLASWGRDDRRKASARRLQDLVTIQVTEAAVVSTSDAPPVDPWLHFIPENYQPMIERAIAATGYKTSIRSLLLVAVLIGGLTYLLGHVVLGMSSSVILPVALVDGSFIAWQVLRFLQGRHHNRFLTLFPDAIDLIVRAVRAGLPVGGSLDAAGHETPEPVGVEFRRIMADSRIGVEFDVALRRAAGRIRLVEFDFFVATLILQRESGGNLSETLSTLSSVLRRRSEMRAKTKAMTSEARTSAIVIGALPIFCSIGIGVFSPRYFTVLLTDPRGGYVVGAAIGSIALGAFAMRALINKALQ